MKECIGVFLYSVFNVMFSTLDRWYSRQIRLLLHSAVRVSGVSHRGLLGQSFDSLMHHQIVWDLRTCMSQPRLFSCSLAEKQEGRIGVNRSKCTLWLEFCDANLHLSPAPVTWSLHFLFTNPDVFLILSSDFSLQSFYICLEKYNKIHPALLLLVRTFSN